MGGVFSDRDIRLYNSTCLLTRVRLTTLALGDKVCLLWQTESVCVFLTNDLKVTRRIYRGFSFFESPHNVTKSCAIKNIAPDIPVCVSGTLQLPRYINLFLFASKIA